MSQTQIKAEIQQTQEYIKLFQARQKAAIKYSTAARQLTAQIRKLKSQLKSLKAKL
jgi:hypothetical protein